MCPCGFFPVGDLVFDEPVLNHPQARSGEVPGVYLFHNLGLLRDDLRLVVSTAPVSIQFFILNAGLALTHGLLDAPGYIGAERFDFLLGEGTVDGDKELAVLLHSVDVLLLKEHGHAPAFEQPCIV